MAARAPSGPGRPPWWTSTMLNCVVFWGRRWGAPATASFLEQGQRFEEVVGGLSSDEATFESRRC